MSSVLGEETADEEECGLSSSLSSLVLRSSATLSEISRRVVFSSLDVTILSIVEAMLSMLSMPMLPASLSSTAFKRFLLLALAGWGGVWSKGVSMLLLLLLLLLLVVFLTKEGLLLVLLVLVIDGEGGDRHIGGRRCPTLSTWRIGSQGQRHPGKGGNGEH